MNYLNDIEWTNNPNEITVAKNFEILETINNENAKSFDRVIVEYPDLPLTFKYDPFKYTSLAIGTKFGFLGLSKKSDLYPKIFKGKHSGEIYDVKWSNDCNLIATASQDTSVRIWDVQKNSEKNIISGFKGHTRSVSFSFDDKLLAIFAEGKIYIWDTNSLILKEILPSIHIDYYLNVCFHKKIRCLHLWGKTRKQLTYGSITLKEFYHLILVVEPNG